MSVDAVRWWSQTRWFRRALAAAAPAGCISSALSGSWLGPQTAWAQLASCSTRNIGALFARFCWDGGTQPCLSFLRSSLSRYYQVLPRRLWFSPVVLLLGHQVCRAEYKQQVKFEGPGGATIPIPQPTLQPPYICFKVKLICCVGLWGYEDILLFLKIDANRS